MTTTLTRLYKEFGQSPWYDNIRRSDLKSGAFKKIVDSGIRGCTSNPTIFDKAIGGSNDYDDAFKRLVEHGKSAEEIYYDLVVEDIQGGADALLDVFRGSEGRDGYISLEVQPRSASDTEKTVSEAKRLVELVSRDNLMIKVPATPEGLPAVTALIGEGISVNVTLIFSVDQYRTVAEAYIAGLEKAHASGQDVSKIASVASFFVSRIDSAVDKKLEAKIKNGEGDREKLESLLGKAAIANAKQAYAAFQEIFSGDRFTKLGASGAHPQRVLWASTGTKNAKYPDTLYVDELIGPDTVNTMPPGTMDAFLDHGTPKDSLESGITKANRVVEALTEVGVPLGPVCAELLEQGVQSFIDSMDSLMNGIASRREDLLK
jgi:transaldolase/glucose-6-phosphate isomerase